MADPLPYQIYLGNGGITVGAYTNTPYGTQVGTPYNTFQQLLSSSGNSLITGKADYQPSLDLLRSYTDGTPLTQNYVDAATKVYQGIYAQSGYDARFGNVLSGQVVPSNYTVGPNGNQMTIPDATNFSPSPQETAAGILPTGTGTAGATVPLTQAQLTAQNAATGQTQLSSAPPVAGGSVDAAGNPTTANPAPATTTPTTATGTTSYSGPSIVDYLNSIAQPSDFASRAVMAAQHGITNYTGTAAQNTQLLNTLRSATSTGSTAPGTNPSGITSGGTSPTSGTSNTGTATTNDPYANLDPVAKQVKMYTDTATALGLPTIKQQYDAVVKQQGEVTDEMNKKIEDAQNNPWFSQGLVDRTVTKIQKSYETKLKTLSNLENLYDAMYKTGQATVESLVTHANADIAATNSLAQKAMDAAAALAKDNQIVSVGGRELLVNKVTGATVADLGASNTTSKGTITSGSLSYTPADQSADSSALEQSRGTDGYVDPTIYQNLYQAWVKAGGSTKDFLSVYPPKDYVNPDNTWLPSYLMPSTASAGALY